VDNLSAQLLQANSFTVEGSFSVPITIDDGKGHAWSGRGLYFHFEQSVDGNGMPVMQLSSTIVLNIASVKTFFNGPPLQRWKVTATDITGNTVTGFINEVTPDFDLGRYTVKFGGQS
jgi:hypothetical protein